MKILLFIVLLAAFCQPVLCQVSGRLVTAGGQPVALANVYLLRGNDSVPLKTALTDDKGSYVIDYIPPGSYRLRVNSVGYQVWQSPMFAMAEGQQTKDLGTHIMAEDAGQLGNVTVRAEKPLYQQQTGGLVVNVENDVLAKGSSALEVLERSPGVVIGHRNNSIALNGKNGVTVMLNGKLVRMPLEQVLVLLGSMSANDIASIELLSTPPAKYDAEGSAGIINIVLKKNKKQGTNGSYSLTGGYGKGEKATGSINLNHNTGTVNTYGSYTYSRNRSYNVLLGRGFEIVPVLGGPATFDYKGISRPLQNSHNATAGIEAALGTKGTLGGSINYNNSTSNENHDNRTLYTVQPDSLLLFNGNIHGVNRWQNIITSLYAEKEMRPGEKINADIDYLYYNNNSPTDVQGSFIDAKGNATSTGGDSLFAPRQRGQANTTIQVGVAKLDYARQLSKKIKLETGIKATYTASASTSGIESFINGEWVSSLQTSSYIKMKESIGAAYASVTIQPSPSASLVLGARYEYAHTRMNDGNTGDVTVNRKLGSLFPNIAFTKKFNNRSSLQFSYTKRISRPSYNDLASYVAYNDPVSVFTGNPLLRPTITNNIKLGYTYRAYAFAVLFSRDDYPIAQGQLTASAGGNIVYISPQNVTYQNNITFQTTLPFTINNWWSINSTFTGGWKKFKLNYTMVPVEKTYFGYTANFSQSFKLPGSWLAEISGSYNSPYYYGSSKVNGYGTLDAGIKKELKNNKGTLQLSVTDLLRSMRINSYIGAVTREVFATTAHIDWSAESHWFPIIRLSYTRTFGAGGAKPRAKQDNGLKDEKDRILTP
jgi:outer membrane receptor protein involved in Fe transport